MKDSTYYKLDRLPLSVTGNELARKEAMKSLRGWLVSQARGPTALGVCMVLAGLAGFGCSSDLGLDGGPTDAMTDSDASIPRDVGPGDTGSPGDTASPDSSLGKACAASATAMSPSGARGGPIRGAVSVFVVNALTRDPVGGAAVLVKTGTITRVGRTDARGCALIEDPELVGPVDLHAFSAGRPYWSLLGIDASEVTIALTSFATEPHIDLATISGHAYGLDAIGTATSATTAWVGVVEPIVRHAFARRPAQLTRQQTNALWDGIAIGGSDDSRFDDYLVRVNAEETLGLVLEVGPFDTTIEVGTITHHSFQYPLALAARDQLMDQDFQDYQALTTTVTVRFLDVSSLFENKFVALYAVLPGQEGIYVVDSTSTFSGDHVSFRAPELVGALAGWSYGAAVSFSDSFGEFTAIRYGVLDQTVTLNSLPARPHDISAAGRSLTAALDTSTSQFALFTLVAGNASRWIVEVIEPGLTPYFELPVPPAGLSDPLSAIDIVVLWAAGLENFDPREFRGSPIENKSTRARARTAERVAF